METPENSDPEPIPATPDDRSQADEHAGRGGPPLPKTLLAALGATVVLALLLFAVLSDSEPAPTSDTEELAALAFLTADGETSNLGAFDGEPLVVNFFASWCAPCRAELPDFEAAHQANGNQVTFVGINHDLDEVTWRNFVAETQVTYETVFQPNTELFDALEAKGMPSTAFISPDGEVLHLYTGILNEDLLQDLIDEHLVAA